ncbi:MAG: TonB-dependent receptor [Deltaproteobacteria bacterium]|nr:TonB-dependent receptor [Deltaproteobacteria bacterium]
MIAAAAAAALLGVLMGGQTAPPSTTVSAPRPAPIDDGRAALDGDALALAVPEDALGALGAVLLHDGGPFSPSRVAVRGLSGVRLASSFEGLALDDPSGLHVDLGLLPWAFADQVDVQSGAGPALGGAVRLARADRDRPALRARVLVGELASARAQGMLTTALRDGALTVGADAASTSGAFSFLPAGAAPGAAATTPLVRANNDQQRASALAAAHTRMGDLHLEGLVLGAVHAGGVPGFALAPTRGLRGEDGLVAGSVGARVQLGAASVGVQAGGRGSHRATEGPRDARSAVQSRALGVTVTAAGVPLGDDVDADLRVLGSDTSARAAAQLYQRVAAGAGVAARARLGPARLKVRADGEALSDVQPLFSGEARLELGGPLAVSLGVARAERAPTMAELYAPSGLVLGNPLLTPERAHDVELALAYRPGRVVQARAVAFAGVIDDAIAYLNQNAFEIAPVNTGPAWRAGAESLVVVEPTPWCALESSIALLASRVDATGAPLPLAPPWSSRLALRAGERAAANMSVLVRARGPAASNAYGTLLAPAVALVDLAARAPLAPGLWGSVALMNLLDVRDARDQNQLPLPGRLWFAGLEVAQ